MKSGLRDWSNLRYFLAVYRAGSTLGAAKTLGAAQPTVARRIEALEHELGLVLFDRDTRGFQPTEAARRLLAAAETVKGAIGAFDEAAADLSSSRPIRITAPEGNFSAPVHKIVIDFSKRYPGTDITFMSTNAVLDLMGGEADIALRMSHLPPDKRLIRRKISTARYALYGSQAYARRHGLPASEAELGDHHFVVYRPDGTLRDSERWILRHASPKCIVRAFAEYELLREAVCQGMGLAILNVRYSKNFADLIACLPPIDAFDQDYLMLVVPAAYQRPEVRQFVKFFAPRYAALFR